MASSKAQSQRQSNGYTAADAEGGAARSLAEDGEEGAAAAPASASQANGEEQEDLAAKVATMQAEVGGVGGWVRLDGLVGCAPPRCVVACCAAKFSCVCRNRGILKARRAASWCQAGRASSCAKIEESCSCGLGGSLAIV